MDQREQAIQKYYDLILRASTEQAKKELLKDLLIRLFDQDDSARESINQMSLGSEKAIFNIQLRDRIKRGAADTQYNKVIIEFEKDLNKTGEHAKYQLSEYLLGNLLLDKENEFTLIATDCLYWVIYAPKYEKIIGKDELSIKDIELKDITNFTLGDTNFSDFYFFLDRFLFHDTGLKATYDNIQWNFGETSQTYSYVIEELKKVYFKAKNEEELKTAFSEWEKFLSISYGSFTGTYDIFLIHTYLSIFAKMLAYTVISVDDFIDEKEILGIITGDIFTKYQIKNFIENDFFAWVAKEKYFNALIPAFYKITQTISRFDFRNVSEDILKGIYQEMIDSETKHALGEHYTPDWLCEKIIEACEFKKDSHILDPSCGSGSFLRAAIAKLMKDFPQLSAAEIAAQVTGIDIHPLSVQISKTTVLLALGKKILKEKKAVQLEIFLSNTLITPKDTIQLIGNNFSLDIDKNRYDISTSVFNDPKLFDISVNVCDNLSELSKGQDREPLHSFENYLKKQFNGNSITVDMIEGFYKIYQGMKEAKEKHRDSIWKFILQNSYKPFFLRQKFDFVIGNPPWLTFADVKNNNYQNRLEELANEYNLLPKKTSDKPHLEIAALFLAHSTTYFLKEKGQLYFVLPRAFLTADHHDNTRSGVAKGFSISQIWDLTDVSVLFLVPSCVIKAIKSEKELNSLPESGIEGYRFSAKTKSQNASLKELEGSLSIEPIKFYYSKLGNRSAFSSEKIKKSIGENYYKSHFKQGATIVPRNCYFVDIETKFEGSLKDRYLVVSTSKESIKEAKKPWNHVNLSGEIHSSFLFNTALAKSIVPFGLIDPPLVILPIKINEEKKKGEMIDIRTWQEIKDEGYFETGMWFKKVEEAWEKHKTERSGKMTFTDRLNFQRGLTSQDLHMRYLVIYTASAKDANAVVVDRKDFELEFIVESKAYVFYTNNLKEAHFLTSYLNSSKPNQMIKAFQSRGLFGPRDVHKKILEIPFPQFDKDNTAHKSLAELGEKCSLKTKKYLSSESIKKINLGRLRNEVKKNISKELNKIDSLVEDLINLKQI